MFYPLFSHFKNLRKTFRAESHFANSPFLGRLIRCSVEQDFTWKNYCISLLAVLLLKVGRLKISLKFVSFEAVKSAVFWIPGYKNICSEQD